MNIKKLISSLFSNKQDEEKDEETLKVGVQNRVWIRKTLWEWVKYNESGGVGWHVAPPRFFRPVF